jgi:hypothetical protein
MIPPITEREVISADCSGCVCAGKAWPVRIGREANEFATDYENNIYRSTASTFDTTLCRRFVLQVSADPFVAPFGMAEVLRAAPKKIRRVY